MLAAAKAGGRRVHEAREFLLMLAALSFFGSISSGGNRHGNRERAGWVAVSGGLRRSSKHENEDDGDRAFRRQGRYRLEKLPAGEYRVQINATGYRADPRAGVSLTADQNASFDFALLPGVVRWNETHLYQEKALWPDGKGKDLLLGNCTICHEFQSRMASVTRDEEGWRDRVEYMRTAEHYALSNITDQNADDLAAYLAKLFGPESVLAEIARRHARVQGHAALFQQRGHEYRIRGIRHARPKPHAVQRDA